jgi:CHAT domain-containing protein
MPEARSALFALEVRRNSHGHAELILLDPAEEPQKEIKLNTVQSNNLPNARRYTFKALWELSEQLDKNRLDLITQLDERRLDLITQTIRQITDNFVRKMNVLQSDIFGRSLPVLRNFVADRAPHLLCLDRDADQDAPLIEVLGGEDILFECLPVFLAPKPIASNDARRYLSTCMRQFLGMSVIVRRTHLSRMCGDLRLLSTPGSGIPIKFFQYAPNGSRPLISFFRYSSLDGVTAEKKFLLDFEKRGKIDFEGPWPMAGATLTGFVNALLRPNLTFSGTTKAIPDQIHHFSCHFESKEDGNDSVFRFRGSETGEIVVKVGDIKDAQVREDLGDPNYLTVIPPLAIVNACSTARDRGLSSLHEMFSRTHRGMMGTEIDIPDEVAAELSKELYEQLLRGNPLGLSLLKARQHILDKYCNPLGLVYTLHANPDLRIAQS